MSGSNSATDDASPLYPKAWHCIPVVLRRVQKQSWQISFVWRGPILKMNAGSRCLVSWCHFKSDLRLHQHKADMNMFPHRHSRNVLSKFSIYPHMDRDDRWTEWPNQTNWETRSQGTKNTAYIKPWQFIFYIIFYFISALCQLMKIIFNTLTKGILIWSSH